MAKNRMFLAAWIVLIIAAPLMGEEAEKPPMSVAQSYFVTVNFDQALEFEAAWKGHLEWHASKNDTWYWHTWQVANGKNLGQYIVRTGDHGWADFDDHAEFDRDDTADFLKNVSQFVHKVSSVMVVSSPEISNWPADYGMPTMVDVTVFDINGGSDDAFYHMIKKLHEAIVEKDMPFHYSWSWVASGGEGSGPTWVLVFPFKSWAEYGESMEPDFWKMVEEVYGEFETNLLRKTWSKSVASYENFIAAYRADLSYNPPK